MIKTTAKEKFERIKELRNSGKTASEISKKLNFKKGYVSWTIDAINKGFDSLNIYRDHTIKNTINPETGKVFESRNEYHNYWARKKGFESASQYSEFRKLIRSTEDKPNRIKQRDFENSIELVPLEDFENIPSNNGQYDRRTEQKDQLDRLLPQIPDRWRTILEMRYYEGKSLEEVGKFLKITRQRVNQLEQRAINHLQSGKSKAKIRQNKKINNGELLLLHILSKSDWYKRRGIYNNIPRLTDSINEIYHDVENIRNSNSTRTMLSSSRYKQRLEKIRERYLPLSK